VKGCHDYKIIGCLANLATLDRSAAASAAPEWNKKKCKSVRRQDIKMAKSDGLKPPLQFNCCLLVSLRSHRHRLPLGIIRGKYRGKERLAPIVKQKSFKDGKSRVIQKDASFSAINSLINEAAAGATGKLSASLSQCCESVHSKPLLRRILHASRYAYEAPCAAAAAALAPTLSKVPPFRIIAGHLYNEDG
jgi:hypothetical protein